MSMTTGNTNNDITPRKKRCDGGLAGVPIVIQDHAALNRHCDPDEDEDCDSDSEDRVKLTAGYQGRDPLAIGDNAPNKSNTIDYTPRPEPAPVKQKIEMNTARNNGPKGHKRSLTTSCSSRSCVANGGTGWKLPFGPLATNGSAAGSDPLRPPAARLFPPPNSLPLFRARFTTTGGYLGATPNLRVGRTTATPGISRNPHHFSGLRGNANLQPQIIRRAQEANTRVGYQRPSVA